MVFAARQAVCHCGRVTTLADDDGVDFAVAAFRADGEWQVEDLTHDHLGDIATLASALRRIPGDAGVLAMVAVDEDFFVLVRVAGADTRVLLSDITAADEWEIARSAVDYLGLPQPDDEDDEPVPAGHLDLLSDLGMPAMDLGVLLDDPDAYPDEILSDVARRLGFGELFDDLVGLTSA
jgi:putative tRNA adenosine deaminase-associated protein